MAGKSGAILDRFYCRIDRTAGVVAEHQDEWGFQHLHGIFKACNNFSAGEIARDAADENVAACRVKAIFGRDAGVGATEDAGEWVLPCAQGLAFMAEVVPFADAVDIPGVTLHQSLKRSVRG